MDRIKRGILGQYIQEKRLVGLRSYKYKAMDKSIMSRYVLRHFWDLMLPLLPKWMAPNLITLVGFIISFSGFAAVLFSSDCMQTPCPAWTYYYIAFVLFAYMTFDALDGKQARRTNSSTPLGQLFDHGCDALNLIFTVFMTWAVFDLEASMRTAMYGVFFYIVFLTSTWEEYHTHILYLGPINGPVEGILIVCIAALITGFFGPQIWHYKLCGLELTSDDVFYMAITLGALASMAASLRNAIRARGFLKILPSFIAILLPQYACLVWFGQTEALWQGSYGLVLFLLHAGFIATNSIFHIIIATVTKSPFPYFIAAYCTVISGLIHCVLCKRGFQLVDDHRLLLTGLCISLFLNVRMALSIIDQTCSYLGIYCLSIKRVEKPEIKEN
jgi:ethanolaminephosphotransferase